MAPLCVLTWFRSSASAKSPRPALREHLRASVRECYSPGTATATRNRVGERKFFVHCWHGPSWLRGTVPRRFATEDCRKGAEGPGTSAGGHGQARLGGPLRDEPLRSHGRGGESGSRGPGGRVLQDPGARTRWHGAPFACRCGLEGGDRRNYHGRYEPAVPGWLRPDLQGTGDGRGPALREPFRGRGATARARGGKRPQHYGARQRTALRRPERPHQQKKGVHGGRGPVPAGGGRGSRRRDRASARGARQREPT